MPGPVTAASPNLASFLRTLKGHTADTATDQLVAYDFRLEVMLLVY